MASGKHVLTKGKKSTADRLALNGQLDEAAALYARVCAMDPTDVEARVKLAVTQRRLGRYSDAESTARRALSFNPRQFAAHHALGAALQCQGRLAEAVASYRQAVELRPDYPDAHYLTGSALMQLGRLHEAEAALRRALELKPQFFEALSDLGAILLLTGQVAQAAPVLQHALALRPNSPEVLANLANLLEMDERVDEALSFYERALDACPDSLDVLAKKAELLEKAGRLDEATAVVSRGLARGREHPLLNLVAARLERRDDRHAEAAARLEPLLSRPMAETTRGEMHLLLGQLYDRLGKNDDVLTHLAEGKRLTAAAADPTGSGRKRFLAKLEHYRALVRGPVPRVKTNPLGDFNPSPIFLIGFPRSGTTLLEQILASHPNLCTLEEKPTAAALEQAYLDMTDGRHEAWSALGDDQIGTLRKAYWNEVSRHTALTEATQIIDKLPLNTVRVPLLWRIFPDARFMIAIRHPCDVTLSCLMQNFGANDAMAGFTTLEGVAEIYAQVMGAWLEFAACLPLCWHSIRYEDLVASPESESRLLLDFIGVEWNSALLDHTRRAQSRAVINTPSYHQVSRPIYQHAKYRWKRYERDFAPIMGVLQPFIDAFGYAERSDP